MIKRLHKVVYFFSSQTMRKAFRLMRRALRTPGPQANLDAAERELGIVAMRGKAQVW